VDAFTATKRSKLSSTRTRIASERESIDARRCEMLRRGPGTSRSDAPRKEGLGSKDLDVRRMDAPEQVISHKKAGRKSRRTRLKIHVLYAAMRTRAQRSARNLAKIEAGALYECAKAQRISLALKIRRALPAAQRSYLHARRLPTSCIERWWLRQSVADGGLRRRHRGDSVRLQQCGLISGEVESPHSNCKPSLTVMADFQNLC